ncbi:MAG TPA: DUF3572 domain-containing protein [Pseudolabrys sp.]|nr:DUF3572 domain-containing protein [Pseudolabrys sp.]
MKTRLPVSRERAEELAIQALTFIAEDAAQLGRFLAITGIGPGQIRDAAREPHFLAGVLEYLTSDERLLTAFASHAQIDAAEVGEAHAALGGGWEQETP